MISSDNRHYRYAKGQLIEVICQLRFPTILSIDTREPADFQETVRAAFPRGGDKRAGDLPPLVLILRNLFAKIPYCIFC